MSVQLVAFNPGGRGTYQNLDRDAHPTSLSLKFGQIKFFQAGKFFKFFFGSFNFCITYLNTLNEKHTVLKNIKS